MITRAHIHGLYAGLLVAAGCSPAGPAVATGQRVVVYGDSLSLVAAPGGWPGELDQLLDRQGRNWTIINRAIDGNGLVWRTRCFGEPASDRLRVDLPATIETDIIVLMAGVNDLIQPRLPNGFSTCFDPGELNADLITARLAEIRQLASKQGRRLLVATIAPFGRSEFFSESAEADRLLINRWIRANWPSHDVIDLATALAGKRDPALLEPAFDSGDGLHPNARGAAAIANSVAEQLSGEAR